MSLLSRIPLLLMLALVLAHPPARGEAPDDILVIVNKSNVVDALDGDELRNIFLGRKTTWNNGDHIIPLNAKEDMPIRATFRTSVLKMTSSEEKRYWINNQMRVKGKEPATVSYKSILKAVYKLKGAVGYIYRSDYKEGVVKIVHVITP